MSKPKGNYGLGDSRNYTPIDNSATAGENIFRKAGEFLNGLWNDVTGASEQTTQFEQQEYLMDKENAYNTPAAQMQRMIEAGINPNTAAAGIAGSPNVSAAPAQVASNGQGVQGALNSLNSIGGSVMNALKLPSEIKNIDADTKNKDADTENTQEDTVTKQIDNETRRELNRTIIDKMVAEKDLTSYQGQIAQSDAKYRDDINGANLNLLRENYLRVSQEIKNLEKEYEVKEQEVKNLIKDLEVKQSVIGLNEANAMKAQYESQLISLQAQFQSQRNQLFINSGFDPLTSPVDAYIMNASPEDAQAYINKLERINYAESKGREKAYTEEYKTRAREDTKQYGIRGNYDIKKDNAMSYNRGRNDYIWKSPSTLREYAIRHGRNVLNWGLGDSWTPEFLINPSGYAPRW